MSSQTDAELKVPSKGTLISHLFDERKSTSETGVNLNPLDESENFQELCEAVRRGDLQVVQYLISFGNVNLNAVDRYDYPPLTLASLCGHYEVCELLLENGATLERNFQGERTLYNALNERIRQLLLKYDYTKASDPLDPWAQHVSTLLESPPLDTTDITILCPTTTESGIYKEFRAHKFLLSARSPYFVRKLKKVEEEVKKGNVRNIRLSGSSTAPAFVAALKYMYIFEPEEASDELLERISKMATHFQTPDLLDMVLITDQKQRRQARRDLVKKAHEDLTKFFDEFITPHDVKDTPEIPQHNPAHADVVLRSDDKLFPAHRAMLCRAEYFSTMLGSKFAEARRPGPNEPLPVITMSDDIAPDILHLLLRHLYLETIAIPVEFALELLYAADSMLLDNLKAMCAQAIVNSGDSLPYSIYDVIRAGWHCRARKLEEFGARYIADRLELYLGDEEFKNLVEESAERIKGRQETDTIEVVDDVRYYLEGRFRRRMEKRFDDVGKLPVGDEEEAEEETDEAAVEDQKLYDQLLEGIDVLLEGLTLEA